MHRRLIYIYLLNVPSFSSRYFNKIKRTSRLGRLLALSLEILSFGEVYGRIYSRKFSFTANENFEYGYPHSNAFLQFRLELERWKPHKAARHPTRCDVINDVKLFRTIYRRIYCRKFLTSSNQTLRYKIKCIRIPKCVPWQTV